MLTQKINKKVSSQENLYGVYLGILEAVTSLKLTKQEKEVLAVILNEGVVNKFVKHKLFKISSKARIENILSKFRHNQILIDDKPNKNFPLLKDSKITLNITINAEETQS